MSDPGYTYISEVNDPIAWTYDEDERHWKACIGTYSYQSEAPLSRVWAFYWRDSEASYGYKPDTPFHWQVRVCDDDDCEHPDSGWIVSVNDSRTARKAQKAAEFIGKEWLKGDSPLWDEGGDDDDGTRAVEAVHKTTTNNVDWAC